MKVYTSTLSNTSLPILMFLAEHDADTEIVLVDLLKGEHLTPEYAALNPNKSGVSRKGHAANAQWREPADFPAECSARGLRQI